MKKLWPRQVGEEKQVVVQKLSRDQEIVLQPENLVATRKLRRDQEIVSRPENLVATKKKLCHDQLAVSRPKMLEKPKKRPKIDILTKFQAHFTLGPYIYSFLGKEDSGKIGEPLSWGFSL